MSVRDDLMSALKDAMKNKDSKRRNVLRLMQSAVKQYEVDSQTDASEEQIMTILEKEAKKRRESIDELTKAGREDQAADEEYELGVIAEFLPEPMTREEIEVIVKAAIESTGASNPKEMGKVMGVVTPQTKGRADGKLVSTIVRELLSS